MLTQDVCQKVAAIVGQELSQRFAGQLVFDPITVIPAVD